MTLVRIKKTSFLTYVTEEKGVSRGVTFPKSVLIKGVIGEMTHFEKKSTIFRIV
jgi:hypothetical protein